MVAIKAADNKDTDPTKRGAIQNAENRRDAIEAGSLGASVEKYTDNDNTPEDHAQKIAMSVFNSLPIPISDVLKLYKLYHVMKMKN